VHRLGKMALGAAAIGSALDQPLADHAVADRAKVEARVIESAYGGVLNQNLRTRRFFRALVSQSGHPQGLR
jgi:hypothetical protein